MIELKEIIYTAGLIDGEGCIGIRKTKPSGRHRSPRYTIKVEVGITDSLTIFRLKDIFGGWAYKIRDTINNWKPYYMWKVEGDAAESFLKLIFPYLRIKKSQAELALEFQKTVMWQLHSSKKVPLEELIKRESYYQKMKILNKRGVDQDVL